MPRKPFAEYTLRDWALTALIVGSLVAFAALALAFEPALRRLG